MEREYWKIAVRGRRLEDFPQDVEFKFLKYSYVAYAVCIANCGRSYFIVDGGPQICEACGGTTFRTLTATYRRVKETPGMLVAMVIKGEPLNDSNRLILEQTYPGKPVPIIREYWKIADYYRKESDYPDIRMVKFPGALAMGYAVCVSECGIVGEIVNESPQICGKCGGMMWCSTIQLYRPVKDKKRGKCKRKKKIC
ncbi:MAG: hypothetical protein ABJA67_13195 [Chthonomonadales bacterium]